MKGNILKLMAKFTNNPKPDLSVFNPITLFLALIVFTVVIINSKGFTPANIKNIFSDDNLVVVVADGDTFQLKSGKRVRLMGVDVPEYDRCGGPEAKQKLTGLILNKQVELKEEVLEEYGRTMALVYVDNTLINREMMATGWGRPDYRKNTQRNVLTEAFKNAKANNLGLWSMCIYPSFVNPATPPDPKCPIKGNIDTATYEKFYHLPTCSKYGETILNTAFGERWFCSEAEAKKAGFVKSKSCY